MTKKMKDTFLFQLPFNFYEIDFNSNNFLNHDNNVSKNNDLSFV